MGLEIISQPQLFLRPLTALNGIEGYAPPYIATFYTWMTSSPVSSFTFPITGNIGLNASNRSESYIVNIDGVVQPPPSYTVDANFRRITFVRPIPPNTDIFITQIGTIAFDDAKYTLLTGYNFYSEDIRTIALSAQIASINDLTITGKMTGNLSASTIFADYIGINVSTATQRLEISGNILLSNKSGLYFRDTLGDTRPMIQGWDNDSVYISAPQDLIFRTENTTTRARISADGTAIFNNNVTVDGNLGVGISTFDSNAKVHIVQDTDGQYPLIVEDSINDTTPFVITSAGNVGIGTNSPAAKLHLQGGGVSNTIIQRSDDTTSPQILHYLSPSTGNTSSGVIVYDPVNPYIDNSISHEVDFERTTPIKPVNYWTAVNSSPTNFFDLPGNSTVPVYATSETLSGAYIVSVGGVIQPPTAYTITSNPRRITFTQSVPANNVVYVLQTINPLISGLYSYSQPVVSISSSPVQSTSFRLTGLNFGPFPESITNDSSYFVAVDGIYQIPNDPPYNITAAVLTSINFAQAVPANQLVTVTKIPSAINRNTSLGNICYLTPFHTWLSASPATYSEFVLNGGPVDISTDKDCYMINVGGVLQVPTSYSFNPKTRTIRFTEAIQPNVNVSVTLLSVPEFEPTYSTKFKITDSCYKDNTNNPLDVLTISPTEGLLSPFQALSSDNSVVTRALGDIRYGNMLDSVLLTDPAAITNTNFNNLLTLSLEANTIYEVTALAFFAQSGTGGSKIQYTYSGTTSIATITDLYTATAALGTTTLHAAYVGTTLPANATGFNSVGGTTSTFRRTGIIRTTTPGTLTLQYGLNTNNGNITAKAGSYIIARKLV
jgi:hypothetical protein